MKTYKDPIMGTTIVITNENHYSIYERYGYEEVKEVPKTTKKTSKNK